MTKQQIRAWVRQHDYALLMNERSKESGVQQRKETGGFHKPGANR